MKSTLVERYKRLYDNADSVSTVGGVIKFLAVIIGGFALVVPIFMANAASGPPTGLPVQFTVQSHASGMEQVALLAGIVNGVCSFLLFMFIGYLLTTLGDILVASLDNAVHSSPFLNDAERAQILSISPTHAPSPKQPSDQAVVTCPQCGTVSVSGAASCSGCGGALGD